VFSLSDSQGAYSVPCGLEAWALGETTMPGTPPKLTVQKNKIRSKVAGSATWKDPQTLEMTWRFIETPHHDTLTCRFQEDDLTIEFMNSIAQLSSSHKDTRPPLKGKVRTA
jgi:hypothetical protein